MNEKSIINKVKAVLGMEVSLEQMALENGTVLEAEAFEAGNEVFIVNEEDRIAVPVGEYELPEGMLMIVSEEGIIAEIKEAAGEEEPAAEEATEEVEEMAAEVEEKVEMSADGVREIVLAILSEMGLDKKEEVKEVEEVEVKASAEDMPAAAPIKSNPEKEAQRKPLKKFSSNKAATTHDRVMARIAKIKKK